MFGGYEFDEEQKLTYAERARFLCRNVDTRHRNVTRLLYMAKRKMENEIRSAANIQMRRIRGNQTVTAKGAQDKKCLQNFIQNDQAFIDYKFTKMCRSSPAFWQARKSEQMAMVQQRGPPQIFLTLSISESKNPDLLASLHENAGLGKISAMDAMNMSHELKSKLIKNDPVTVVIYFEEMLKDIKRILQDSNGPFAEKFVVDSYVKREFQNRGSVHAHALLWLKNVPHYDEDSSNGDLIQFVDKIVTCHYDPKHPLMAFQRHKHTHTCYKKKKSVCRFHFPKYIMHVQEF